MHCMALRLGCAVLFLLLPHCAALGQTSSPGGDSARVSGVVLVDPGISMGTPTLIFPPSFQPMPELGMPFIEHAGAGLPPNFLDWQNPPKADLLSPYLLKRESEKKLSTLYSIVGAVQLGAVAYVAYRHVKKFGF